MPSKDEIADLIKKYGDEVAVAPTDKVELARFLIKKTLEEMGPEERGKWVAEARDWASRTSRKK